MCDSVTAQTIEDSLVVAPRNESMLFANRDKFDLIAVYDESSETFGDANSPLAIFVRAVYERAFRKILKHPPMLLVGGLQAWKREFGETELVRGGSSTGSDVGDVPGPVNGMASLKMNGVSTPPTTYHEARGSPLGHVRAPAEVAPPPAFASTPSYEQSTGGRHRAGTESSVDAHRPWIPPQPTPPFSPEQSPASFRSVCSRYTNSYY